MDKLQQVYDLYLSQGLLSDNISFEQFSAADEEQQNKLYTLGKENGLFSTTGADTFKSAWGSQSFQTDPVKETADAGSENQAVSTELPLADTLSVSEKKKLSYKERQDLVHGRGRFAQPETEYDKLQIDKQRLINAMTLPEQEINIINNSIENIDFTPRMQGTYMGALIEVTPYEEELKQAEDALKKSGQSYNKSDIEDYAKNIIKRNKISESIDNKHEEILEEIKNRYVGFGDAFLDLIGAKNKNEEYEAVRLLLESGVKEEKEKRAKEYTDTLAKLELDHASAKDLFTKLSDYDNKIKLGSRLTEQEVQDYNNNVSLLNAYKEKTDKQLAKLSGLQYDIENFESLADLTRRSYSIVDKIEGRIGTGIINLAGAGAKIGEEFTITALADNFLGIDLTNEEDLEMLPENLRPIVSQFFGISASKEKTLGNVANYLFEESEKITGGIERRQEFGKIGSLEDFFEFTTDLFSEQALNTAITAGIPGAGLAIVSAGAAGQKMRDMDLEMADGKKYSGLQYYGSALASFGAEYLTEKIALDNFNKLAKANYKKAFALADDYTLDVNKMTARTAFGNWAKSVVKEGGAEGAAQFINNVSDRFLLDKDVALTDGLVESFASGAIMSGLGFSAPVLAVDLVNAFNRNDDIIKHNDTIKEIISLTNEVNKLAKIAATDPSVKPTIKALQQDIDNLYQQSITYTQNTADRVDNLTNKEKRKLLDLDSSIYNLKKQIDNTNKDNNLSIDIKAKRIDQLRKKVFQLTKYKDNILNTSQFTADAIKAGKFQNNEIIKNGFKDKLEVINAKNNKDALLQINNLIDLRLSQNKITEEQADKLRNELKQIKDSGKEITHGYQLGAELGLPIAVALESNATLGLFGNATVFSHEIGHGTLFRKLISQGGDVISLVDMMEDYARKNIKGANKVFDKVKKDYAEIANSKNKIDQLNYAEERFLALKDAYRKRADIRKLDKTFQGKLLSAWKKLAGKDISSENEVKTGEDVVNLMTSFVSAFETGEITGSFKALMEGRLKTVKAETAQKVKEGTIKMSKITPSQQEMNDRVDKLVGKKDADGNYIWDSKEEFQMSEEFANTYEQIIAGNLIDPLITRGIEGDEVRGISIDDFIQQVKDGLTDLLLRFDPTENNSLIGFINSQLRFRKGDVLNKLKAQQPTRAKSIDTEAGETGAVTGAEQVSAQTAEDTVDVKEREAREAKEVKKPIKDRLKFGPAKEKIITKLKEKLAERVKYRISLFDAAKSKNKFTTDFVRDLHKDLQEAAYEIIMEGMNPQDIQAFERFLSDNYVEILEGLTTTYLSRAFPEAIQKKIVGEGWVNYPKWKGAKRGAKKGNVEFWKATEEGPYKGNTSGPQKIRRIKNIRNTIPKAQFTSKYIKGNEFVERSTEALARQLAAEMSLDILVEEIKSDGPIAQSLFERQELIRGMASTMAANDVIAQIERPGIKFSARSGKVVWEPLDTARTNINDYVRTLNPQDLEDILSGKKIDLEFRELFNKFEEKFNEYLLRDNANSRNDKVRKAWVRFKEEGFDKGTAMDVLKFNIDALQKDLTYYLQVNKDAIKIPTNNPAKSPNVINAVDKGFKSWLDNKLEDVTNDEAIENILSQAFRLFRGTVANFDVAKYASEKNISADIIKRAKNNSRKFLQETSAPEIANIIKGKPDNKGRVLPNKNTKDLIAKRNESALEDQKVYKEYLKFLRDKYQSGAINNIELGYILQLMHTRKMQIIGKSLAVLEDILLEANNNDTTKYTYEHQTPTQVLKIAAANYIMAPQKNAKDALQNVDDVISISKVTIIPDKVDKIVNEVYQDALPKDFKIGEDNPRTARYLADEVQKRLAKKNIYIKESDFQNINSEYFIPIPIIKKSQTKLINNNNKILPKAQQVKGEGITNQQVLDKMAAVDKKEAEIRFSKINPDMLNKQFNVMIEQTTGIKSESEYSEARAKMDGRLSGKKWWFIPPTAQDFMGLMYAFVGKGKVGDAQLKWIQRNLVSPYARAAQEITRARRAMYRDYDALKKELKIVPKDLKEKIPGSSFTVQHAVRAYIFTQEGHEIPGLTEKEARELKKYVADRPDLIDFAEKIRSLLKGTQMAKPRKNWTGGTITTDLLETLNTTKRAEALAEWQANVDAIFSKENLNKIEALYGSNFRYALENSLMRMKTGRNRNYGPDSQVGKWMDWLNSQTGTIMFFNMRSAVLQTISTLNFMNWSDNNPLEAAKAFANQKQYWTDFFMLFNSDFLVDRRDGLKMEVNESDIADMAKEGASFQTIVNKVLKAGFVPTQIADSFAIAAGGATFYRNRLNRYIKEGMEPDKAAEQAFMDFRETAEEAQQSSRPDKISAQQAGNLGRFILAFANTPAQYARLMNKAYLDLKNGRGDAKTNISKIIYYGAAQNLLFNALQQALFAFAFDEDEEKEKEKNEKYLSVANGMFDSVLRGIGVHGAIIATLKNTAIELYKESGKDTYKQEFGKKAVIGLSGIAPPLNSKIRKLYKAGDIYKYNNKEIKQMGWDIDNPAFLAGANVISSVSNLPTDRMVQKSININDALTEDITTMQRIALFAGWSGWNLKIPKYDRQSQSRSSQGKGFNRKRRGFKPRKF